jgi:hypothetical protein
VENSAYSEAMIFCYDKDRQYIEPDPPIFSIAHVLFLKDNALSQLSLSGFDLLTVPTA